MLFISLIFHSLVATFTLNDTTGINVTADLLKPATAEEIAIKVTVKNNTIKPFRVLETRTKDYVWVHGYSLGNYIIEIQNFQNDSFHVFAPSADIGAVFEPQVFIKISPGQSIIDTLTVNGRSFSRGGKGKFPPGIYRMNVSFNANSWSRSQENCTNWIEFKIE